MAAAVAAGVVLAGSAGAATTVGLGGTFTAGQARTYTIDLGPDLITGPFTPYVELVGHGLLGSYYEFLNPDGSTGSYIDYTGDAHIEMTCKGFTTCLQSSTNFNGGATTFSVVSTPGQMVISVDDQFGSFNHCSLADSHWCAGSFSQPFYLTAYFRFDGVDEPELAFTTLATGTPEPATWAMMIAGFGMVGASLRRLKPQTQA